MVDSRAMSFTLYSKLCVLVPAVTPVWGVQHVESVTVRLAGWEMIVVKVRVNIQSNSLNRNPVNQNFRK